VLDPRAPRRADRSGDHDALDVTRSTNARIAGAAYLLYIAVAFPSMLLSGRSTAGEGMAAKLASMAQHAGDVRLAAVLGLLGCCCALVLAVTLYAVTRDEDRDVAMFGLTCRVAEGITGAVGIPATLALLSAATASGAEAPNADASHAVAAFVLRQPSAIGAWFFAVGSTAFSWLLLRGRMIPLPLAWLGVAASVLLVIALPLQIGALLHSPLRELVWLPMAAFEIPLGVWLIVKGVRPLRSGTGQARAVVT
jgi:hypothetical protein